MSIMIIRQEKFISTYKGWPQVGSSALLYFQSNSLKPMKSSILNNYYNEIYKIYGETEDNSISEYMKIRKS